MNYEKDLINKINKFKRDGEDEDIFIPPLNRQMNTKKIKKKKYERVYEQRKTTNIS